MGEKKQLRCAGCRDNFYNGNNDLGVSKCWGLKTAKKCVRFRIDVHTMPASPFAFTKITTNSCFHQQGYAFYEKLPSFVDRTKVSGIEQKKAKAQ